MNRLKGCFHTVTRWPQRSSERAALARTTLEYLEFLSRIYRDEPEEEAMFMQTRNLFLSALDKLSLAHEVGGEG